MSDKTSDKSNEDTEESTDEVDDSSKDTDYSSESPVESSKTGFVIIKNNENKKYLTTVNYGNHFALTDKAYNPMSYFSVGSGPAEHQIFLHTYLSTPVCVTSDKLVTKLKPGGGAKYLYRSSENPRSIHVQSNGEKKYLCSDLQFHKNPDNKKQWCFKDLGIPTLKIKNIRNNNNEEMKLGDIKIDDDDGTAYVSTVPTPNGKCKSLYFENFFDKEKGQLTFKGSCNGNNKTPKKVKDGKLVNSNKDDTCFIVPKIVDNS